MSEDRNIHTPPDSENWPPGRQAVQRYFIAGLEAQRFYDLCQEASQRVIAENDEAVAYLKEHGPVDIVFNNDDNHYQARLSPLGSPVLVVVNPQTGGKVEAVD